MRENLLSDMVKPGSGADSSPCKSFRKAATWKACTEERFRRPLPSHHAAKRRVAFRYAFLVWSLLICAVENSSARFAGQAERGGECGEARC